MCSFIFWSLENTYSEGLLVDCFLFPCFVQDFNIYREGILNNIFFVQDFNIYMLLEDWVSADIWQLLFKWRWKLQKWILVPWIKISTSIIPFCLLYILFVLLYSVFQCSLLTYILGKWAPRRQWGLTFCSHNESSDLANWENF